MSSEKTVENGAGKGDKRRERSDDKSYRDNYDQIDWTKKKDKQQESLESSQL